MTSLTPEDMKTIKMVLSGWVNSGLDEIARRETQLSMMGPVSSELSHALRQNIEALRAKVGMGSDLLRRLAQ